MEITIRKLRENDADAFRNDILTSSLYTDSICDLDLLCAEYDHVLLSLKDKYAPLKVYDPNTFGFIHRNGVFGIR